MKDESLREALEGLRQEINSANLSSGPARERLNGLIGDIERKLEQSEDEEQDASLIDSLKEGISQLETEYPRATALLNRIMASLGGAGI